MPDDSDPTSAIPFTPIVAGLPSAVPFVGPETLERRRGKAFEARVGANESAFGPSPLALEAMRREAGRISWYGDPENHDLRYALAAAHGVKPEEICVGTGIDGLLGLIVRMLVQPGAPVVTSHGAYPTFNYHVAGFGGRLETVPYRSDREDPEALLEKAEAVGAPLVYFANPDNPMGSWWEAGVVKGMIDSLPAGRVLALDEAYVEFAPDGTSPPVDTDNPRVIRLRTFSKAHGMAGARVGYAIAHRDLITGLNKVRSHFEVNRIAQAGALASLLDSAHVASVIGAVRMGRDDYSALAQSFGMTALPSATNFVAIDVGSGERARALLSALNSMGVFIRMPGVPPLDRCIRISVGTPTERELVAEALRRAVQEEAA